MQWEISGANRDTGTDVTILVEADNQDSAIRRASRRGVMVTSAVPRQTAPAQPTIASPAPPSMESPVIAYAQPFSRSTAFVPPEKKTSGLGVAGLILGIIALVICWIPILGFFALPLGALGVILAGVGLIVAMTGKRHSIGIPIAGTATSIVALIGFGVVATLWAAVFRSASTAMQQSIQQQQLRQQQLLRQQQSGQPPQP